MGGRKQFPRGSRAQGSFTFLPRFSPNSECDLSIPQWRIQDFHKGDAEQGVWGTEVPQRGPGAEPRWAKFTTHIKRKLKYKEIKNTTKT